MEHNWRGLSLLLQTQKYQPSLGCGVLVAFTLKQLLAQCGNVNMAISEDQSPGGVVCDDDH